MNPPDVLVMEAPQQIVELGGGAVIVGKKEGTIGGSFLPFSLFSFCFSHLFCLSPRRVIIIFMLEVV